MKKDMEVIHYEVQMQSITTTEKKPFVDTNTITCNPTEYRACCQ